MVKQAAEPLVQASGLTKSIRGVPILGGLSFEIRAGEVVGFIGPNGAGKTTLIRLISGMARKSGGELRVSGMPMGDGRPASGIGLLPESPGFIEHLSGIANLKLLASIRRLVTPRALEDVMRRVGLDPGDPRPVAKFSLGMRQRLGLAQAIMERPRLLMLDEPTNGLDVLGITMVRDIVRDSAKDGIGVLLASHLLTEVELACDRVTMIRAGEIVAQLETQSLRRIAGRIELAVTTERDWAPVHGAFETRRTSGEGTVVRGVLVTDESVPAVVRKLVGLGVSIESIAPGSSSLEDVFIAAMQETG